MPALMQMLISLIGGGVGQFAAKKGLSALAGKAGTGALGRFAGSKAGQFVGGDLLGFGGGASAASALAGGLQGDVEAGEPDLQQFNSGEDMRLEQLHQNSDLVNALAEMGIDVNDLNLPNRGIV